MQVHHPGFASHDVLQVQRNLPSYLDFRPAVVLDDVKGVDVEGLYLVPDLQDPRVVVKNVTDIDIDPKRIRRMK